MHGFPESAAGGRIWIGSGHGCDLFGTKDGLDAATGFIAQKAVKRHCRRQPSMPILSTQKRPLSEIDRLGYNRNWIFTG
jgi:hypothetical protein